MLPCRLGPVTTIAEFMRPAKGPQRALVVLLSLLLGCGAARSQSFEDAVPAARQADAQHAEADGPGQPRESADLAAVDAAQFHSVDRADTGRGRTAAGAAGQRLGADLTLRATAHRTQPAQLDQQYERKGFGEVRR